MKMDPQEPILPLRAHHGMCLCYFRGAGYSTAFTTNMAAIKKQTEANPLVRVIDHTDVLCGCCPNNRNGRCRSAEKVLAYDRQVLLRCGIPAGTVLRFKTFEEQIRRRILLPGRRAEICGDCQWNDLCGGR